MNTKQVHNNIVSINTLSTYLYELIIRVLKGTCTLPQGDQDEIAFWRTVHPLQLDK